METKNIINIIGLCLDISGVVLLFIYGIPSDVRKGGFGGFLQASSDKKESDKYDRHKKWSNVGLGLIILGFFFQIISVFLSSIQ